MQAKEKKPSCFDKTVRCFKPCFKDKVFYMNLRQSIICNFIVVILLGLLGIALRSSIVDKLEYRIRYDDKCVGQSTCKFDFVIREKATAPVYLYLHFKNFFINHRNIAGSFSDA